MQKQLWQYNLYQVSRNVSCNINFCNCPFPGYILELALLFMYASVCNNAGIVIIVTGFGKTLRNGIFS